MEAMDCGSPPENIRDKHRAAVSGWRDLHHRQGVVEMRILGSQGSCSLMAEDADLCHTRATASTEICTPLKILYPYSSWEHNYPNPNPNPRSFILDYYTPTQFLTCLCWFPFKRVQKKCADQVQMLDVRWVVGVIRCEQATSRSHLRVPTVSG